MADYLGLIKGTQLVEISNDFNYMRATENFVGLRLFPLFKTDNMKLAVVNLMDGADIPVMAFVHALDTEAKIGDRPNYNEIDFQLLLIKEKLNQGEELRKKMLELGMKAEERTILQQIFNDAANLISRVLTRMEVMACELLSTGTVTVKENGVDLTIDYHLPATHAHSFSGWSDPAHDIFGDISSVMDSSNDSIVRALIPKPLFGHIMKNEQLIEIAAKQGAIVTKDWATKYIDSTFGLDVYVTNKTYKKRATDTQEHHFFKQDVITFLTTEGEVGKTFVTTPPEVDYGIADRMEGYVAVTQYKSEDPAGIWTKASAIALPCPSNINSIYLATVGE